MGNVITNLKELFRAHREVWGNESYRTNTMLSTRVGGINYNGPRAIARAILVLEHYDGRGSLNQLFTAVVYPQNGEIYVMLALVLSASCSCLKAMHLEARKTLPKLGVCYHCKEKRSVCC